MKRLLIVLDSMRYDVFKAANTKLFDDLLGPTSKKSTVSAQTAPSFYSFMMWNELPKPSIFKLERNYIQRLYNRKIKVNMYTGLPTLHPTDLMINSISKYFNIYRIYDEIDCASEIISDCKENIQDANTYTILWFGETHAPFNYGESITRLWLANKCYENYGSHIPAKYLRYLKERQKLACEYLVRMIYPLITKYDGEIIVTSDHGELFGEDNKFGHGISSHPKQLEVPLLYRPDLQKLKMIEALEKLEVKK